MRIAAGKLQIGLWCSLCSNIAADIVRDSGFDWLLLDTEHSPNEIPDLVAQLQAVEGGTATPIVRPAWNDTVLIKRCLDIGAQALLVPYVQNAEEAKSAVAAIRYPPRGVRGVAGSARAPAAMAGSPTISRRPIPRSACWSRSRPAPRSNSSRPSPTVDGVDGVFIGPSDLSASLGHLGNPAHPEVQKALEDAVRRLKAVGKPAGILTGNEEEARRYIGWGYTFVAVGSDVGLLGRGADALAKKFKG